MKFDSKVGERGYQVKTVSMIFSKEINGGYRENDRFDLLVGDSMHYTDQVMGFRFTVSPFAFF